MDAIISVICYKSKTLANGEHPLMLRIAQNGKSTYKSLKISVAAKHWDFDKNVPKPNNPHKDLIQKIILKTKLDYQQHHIYPLHEACVHTLLHFQYDWLPLDSLFE